MTIAILITVFIAAIFAFIVYIISLFPGVDSAYIASGINSLLKYGLALLPSECWATFLASIVALNGSKFVWVIVEWVYKKIPGVD